MMEDNAAATATRRTHVTDLILVALLAGASAVVFAKDITIGGFRWGDAPVHAMDGVLILDWLSAGPQAWIHPVSFAERQYAFYPTLGIGRVYPPGFAIVEGIFFAVFGVSVIVARLTTVFFGVLAVIGAFLVARRCLSRYAAVATAACLLGIPSVVLWTRQTMLEMPTLCVLIWLTFAVQRYLDGPTWTRCTFVVLLALTAPAFKQTALFIIPILGILMVVKAVRRCIPWRHIAVAAIAIAVPVGAAVSFWLWSGGRATHNLNVINPGNSMTDWLSWSALLYYPRTLPDQVGWIVLIVAAFGFLETIRRLRAVQAFLIAWFLTYLGMIALIDHRQPRYLFFAFFPIAMWFGCAVELLLSLVLKPRVSASDARGPVSVAPIAKWKTLLCCGTALMIALGLVARGYAVDVPIYPDYGPMVAANADRIHGHIVFFEGRRDGDFIFAVRRQLGPKKAIVVRGSKLLYSCAADAPWQFASYVSGTDGVERKLAPFAFHALFVERENVGHFGEVDLLHDYLRKSRAHSLVDTWALEPREQVSCGRRRTVDIYVPNEPAVRTVQYVEIPIPINSRTLRVDIREMARDLPGG